MVCYIKSAEIEIKYGITGFNNVECKIIYVKYHQNAGPAGPGPENLVFTSRGGKAFIYAAFADDYDQLVTYTPNPVDCETSGNMGNVFEIPHLLTHIDYRNPKDPTRLMFYFAEHFGNDWYFCKRDPYYLQLK